MLQIVMEISMIPQSSIIKATHFTIIILIADNDSNQSQNVRAKFTV